MYSAAVRARAPLPMPTCESEQLHALATLTEGVPAMSTLARTEQGAMVAYVTDANQDGNGELMLLPLDVDGHPVGQPSLLSTGSYPAHPVLASLGRGYLLAWREGAPGQERIAIRELNPDGTVTARAFVTQPLPTGWLGPPAMTVSADGVFVAVVRSGQRPADLEARRGDVLVWTRLGGDVRTVRAPEGGLFDAEHPPLLVARGAGSVRLFALTMARNAAPGDERALVEVPTSGQGPLRLVARDLDAPTALGLPVGVLLGWRARVSARDVAARVYLSPDQGEPMMPPVTVATFRGAFDARVELVPMDEGRLGAFTLSTLADDAGGSLNVSVLTTEGEYVGRQPLLVSSLVRNARLTAASLQRGDAWFLLEARGDDGSGPVLGLASVNCHSDRPVDRLQIPPPTLVQRLGSLDEPPVNLASLAQGASAVGRCEAVGAPVPFVQHTSGEGNVLAGTHAAAVSLSRVVILFAVVRDSVRGSTRLVASVLDHRGVLSAPRTVLSNVTNLLAVGTAAGRAVAVVSAQREGTTRTQAMVVYIGSDGRSRGFTALPIDEPTSAVTMSETVLLVGADRSEGDVSLFMVPWHNGRAGAPVVVTRLKPGDWLTDAMRNANGIVALLARPDALGGEVSRALAAVTIPDSLTEATRRAVWMDPFADPLGYGRGDAMLIQGTTNPIVIYHEGAFLRAAELDRGELRNLRSVVGVLNNGGELLGWSHGQSDTHWVAVRTGYPEDSSQRISPMTLVRLGPRATVTAVTSSLPDDAGAMAERVALTAQGERLVLVYARPETNGTATWMVARATCTAGSSSGSP